MAETAADIPDDEKRQEQAEAEDERIELLVQRAAVKLAEHCDSVRIIVTTNRGDGLYGAYSYGHGNFYAQRDSVREWLIRQDQSSRNEAP